MVIVRHPTLTISANSATVLLDTVQAGFQVYDALPELKPRLGQDSYENIAQVILSSSGTAVGLWTTNNELTVLTAGSSQTYPLPHPPAQIRALALADAGDKVAILLAFAASTLKAPAERNGALEIWTLPVQAKPLATLEIPVLDRVQLAANGSLSKFFVHSTASTGSPQVTGIYAGQGEEIVSLWSTTDPGQEPTDAALYGEWVWLTQADTLEGWRDITSPVQLSGTLRDRLQFSPDGNHLLAYRVEKNVSIISAEILFRLFDLNSLTEIRQITHTVEQPTEAHFVLSPELELLELRATQEAQVSIKELSW